jgi:hypothetical protein
MSVVECCLGWQLQEIEGAERVVFIGETRNVCRSVAGKPVEGAMCWAEDRDRRSSE